MADSSSTVNKAMAIGGLVFQAAIIGLLIWLVYKAYQCGTDNSMCSTFIYNIIRTGTKYDKYTGLVPFSNVEAIETARLHQQTHVPSGVQRHMGVTDSYGMVPSVVS
jgi:hypothetical protein